MKKVLLAFLPWLFTAFSYKALAQEAASDEKKEDKKETQEIIIRKKGDKDVNLSINITGDKVTVNGKPLIEFKDDAVSINKRNIIIRDGDDLVKLDGDLLSLTDRLGSMNWSFNDDGKPVTFLGVTTDKVDEGAKISDVTEESGAAKAGLKEGDIITRFGDTKIDGPESLSKAVRARKAKDEVKITYLRDGKEKTTKATLTERKNTSVFSYSGPDGSYKTLTIPQARAYGDMLRSEKLGATVPRAYNYGGDGYTFAYGFPRQKLGLKIQDTEDGNGVKVLEVEENSAAATAGVKKDDIITEIAGEKVTNTDEARDQLQENREKGSYSIKAKRNGTEMSFEIKIPKKLKTANL